MAWSGADPDHLSAKCIRWGLTLTERPNLQRAVFREIMKKTLITGSHYGLSPDRLYRTFEEMAQAEAKREDGIDFVVITTPNSTHYPVSKAFLESGIHVVCDKPLAMTSEEGRELKRIAESKGLRFCVTYTYTGYTMVKQARQMILKRRHRKGTGCPRTVPARAGSRPKLKKKDQSRRLGGAIPSSPVSRIVWAISARISKI